MKQEPATVSTVDTRVKLRLGRSAGGIVLGNANASAPAEFGAKEGRAAGPRRAVTRQIRSGGSWPVCHPDKLRLEWRSAKRGGVSAELAGPLDCMDNSCSANYGAVIRNRTKGASG